MTDPNSDVWRRTEGTTTKRLWAQGTRAMLAGSRELTHLGDETMRTTMERYGPERQRAVSDIAPRGARSGEGHDHESGALPSDPAFDDFLATFEPDLPLVDGDDE